MNIKLLLSNIHTKQRPDEHYDMTSIGTLILRMQMQRYILAAQSQLSWLSFLFSSMSAIIKKIYFTPTVHPTSDSNKHFKSNIAKTAFKSGFCISL